MIDTSFWPLHSLQRLGEAGVTLTSQSYRIHGSPGCQKNPKPVTSFGTQTSRKAVGRKGGGGNRHGFPRALPSGAAHEPVPPAEKATSLVCAQSGAGSQARHPRPLHTKCRPRARPPRHTTDQETPELLLDRPARRFTGRSSRARPSRCS